MDDDAATAPVAASSSPRLPVVVRVVEQCHVSPSSVEEVSVPFTFWDVVWVGKPPVVRLFFYRWPGLTTPHFAAAALPRLKRSLSLALRRYYPLAGRLRPPQPAPELDKFHIFCTVEDSVPFTLAELCSGAGAIDGDDQCPSSFDHLAGNQPRGIDTLRPLVPEIPPAADGGEALTALQVTVFPGSGVCVGVSIRHAACDGAGFTSFVKTWASTCRMMGEEEEAASSLAGERPVIDRTLVSDSRGRLYSVFYNQMSRGKDVEWPAAEGPDVLQATFLLRRADIEDLRRQVSEQGAAPPPPARYYSSFVLSCAYVWVCLLKAAATAAAAEELGDAAYFCSTVDCRSRVAPPLPSTYFGNCLGVCFVEARRRDLVSERGGVRRAAEAIASAVDGLGKDGEVLRDAEEWIPKVLAWLPSRPLSVAGSPRFGVYGADFGWGQPAKVEMLGLDKTGTMSLAESRHGDGGVEVGVALPSVEMAEFSSLFSAGLRDNNRDGGWRNPFSCDTPSRR